MIWSIWSGISKEVFFNNFREFQKKKIKKKIINDTFLTIENLSKLAIKRKRKLMSLDQINNYDDVEYFIFFDMPDFNENLIQKIKRYKKKFILITAEAKEIHPQNFNIQYFRNFKYIFTYNDRYVDNKKVFYYHFGVSKPKKLKKIKKNKFSCMISSNRIINYDISLYPLRLKIIKWFEKNKSQDFDLYGQGWERKLIDSKLKIFRSLNRINFLSLILRNNFKNYKGEIKPLLKNKFDILKKYKFSFVIENFNTTNGWITEKIFHCFFCDVIPIYLGPPNISRYIPKNTYIDFNQFTSLDELYIFLKKLNLKKKKDFLANKNIFLKSKKFNKFDIKSGFSIIKKLL